jgi:anti-sigma factor RsiW
MDIHAFVDGELSPDEAASVRLGVEQSPLAAREAEAIPNLKTLLKQKVPQVETQTLWSACVKRLDEVDRVREAARARRIEWLVSRFAPGLCIVLFAGILIVGQFSRHSDRGNVSGPDFAKMVGGFKSMEPPKDRKTNFERWQVAAQSDRQFVH